MSDKKPNNCRWVIVSVNKPVMMPRSDDETWLLNPRRRYVLNADLLHHLEGCISTLSDLNGSTHYRPLHSATRVRLPGATILVERYRDRGLGDLLFTTGPLAYLSHITGGDIKSYVYAYAERGAVLNHCPYIAHASPLVGPIMYDADLPFYTFHWFVDTVTEFNEEPDQLNVYDSLYKSLGVDPAAVDAQFKRPYAFLTPAEIRQLDDFFYWVFLNTKPQCDLRKTGYYVVAPFSNSNLRTASYQTWLQTIEALSIKRPVVVIGALRERMPFSDISAGDFISSLDQSPNLVPSGRVVNLIGKTQVRNLMQLISKANCVVSMDSASLYIAQAFRTPCVSLWGSHDPASRIGYDRSYMELAIWERQACAQSPCYAWSGFPENKCPGRDQQIICECFKFATTDLVMKRVELAESWSPRLIVPEKPPVPELP